MEYNNITLAKEQQKARSFLIYISYKHKRDCLSIFIKIPTFNIYSISWFLPKLKKKQKKKIKLIN